MLGAGRQPITDTGAAMWRDREGRMVLALLAVAFLYPVVVCAVAYPTPYIDIVELRSWGLSFPLYTWKHPPLQAWVIGAASLIGPVDAWFYMLIGSVLNVVALLYLALIARDFIGRDAVLPVVIAAGGSAYLAASLPTIALNADQLQAPLWAGLIYHAMRAARDDRWRDWIVVAVLLALAFLTKYFVVVLMASLLIAAAAVPAYRRLFANVKLYLTGVLALLLVLPYLIALRMHPEALGYGEAFFSGEYPRLAAIWNFAHPALFTAGAIGIAALLLYRTGLIHIRRESNPDIKFLLIAAAAFAVILLGLIVIGLNYSQRYSYPFAALSVLICVASVRIDPPGLPRLTNFMLAVWGLIVCATAVYAFTVLRRELTEPAPVAATAIERQWRSTYACGPAYVIGAKDAAFRVAFYFVGPQGQVIGAAPEDYQHAQWIDHDRIRREGAVLIAHTADALAHILAAELPNRSAAMTLSLPYRRTSSEARQGYAYAFVAPQGC
jgi:hypothetical protein